MLGEYAITGTRASEIAASVEGGISAGELAPGTALPPMRELAARLGVNPNTVAAAYRTLRDRGLIETDGRRGSKVRARPATVPRESLRVEAPPGVRGIGGGNPDPGLLPPLTDALAAAARAYAHSPRLYGEEGVDPELERLARAQLAADGVPADHLALASGSLDAVERVLAAHLKPGDAVAVEDPGWGSLLDLVPALGLRMVPVALDDDGPLPGSVADALAKGARALLVTCRAQNPTGAAVGAARAAELRALLAGHPHVLVVEDDHGHGMVDLPLHPLAGATGHWAFVRSTAKAYGPDLRLALLAGDRTTVDRVHGRYRLGPGWVSRLLQHVVVELWTAGTLDTAAVAGAYRERRELLIGELARRGVPAHGRSGLNVWVPVDDETGVVARMLRAGWAVAPGARFRLDSPPGVRLSVSALAPADLPGLAADLAAAMAVRPGRGVRYD